MKVHKIKINEPFQLRIVESNSKVAILIYHSIFETPCRTKCILLSRDEAKQLHKVLGKILKSNEDNPIKSIEVEEDVN